MSCFFGESFPAGWGEEFVVRVVSKVSRWSPDAMGEVFSVFVVLGFLLVFPVFCFSWVAGEVVVGFWARVWFSYVWGD